MSDTIEGMRDMVAKLASLRAQLAEQAATIERVTKERDAARLAAFIGSRVALSGRLPEAYSDEQLVKDFAPYWASRDVTGLSPREVRLLETIIDRNVSLAERAVTCAFCGHSFPDGTPTTQDERLAAHVRVCEKHPMRETEADLAAMKARAERAEGEAASLAGHIKHILACSGEPEDCDECAAAEAQAGGKEAQ